MNNTSLFRLIYLLLICSAQTVLAQSMVDLQIVPASPLRNPDRGFHLESNYFVHNYVNPFRKSEVYPDGFIPDRLKRFHAEGDSLTLTQLYLYLSEYVNEDIPQDAFERMQVIFDDLKERGYKVKLRFAYNYGGLNSSGGETEEGIMRHLEQLRPFLRKNCGLIAVCQMGFIGAWGEWHSSPLSNNQQAKDNLVNKLLEIFPEDSYLQMRYPAQKDKLSLKKQSDWFRIGFSNDYFTAGEHSHAPNNDFVPGDEAYEQVKRDSPYFFMSGEIPYDEQTEWGLHDLISVDKSLQILKEHHYSALDVTQNNELNLRHWKQYKVYPELLDSLQILYSNDYFLDEAGTKVARSAYDFVRDHLGYRLNLLSSSLHIQNKALQYDVTFTNTGFATVMNPHKVYLVLIDEEGKLVKELKLDVQPKDWQPYDLEGEKNKPMLHRLKGEIEVSLKGIYKVGIWMPDRQSSLTHNPLYDIRWVENRHLSHWADGERVVNILGQIEL